MDGVDGEVVSAMEGWELAEEWDGVMGRGEGMDGVRMDDNGGKLRWEGREMECDGC